MQKHIIIAILLFGMMAHAGAQDVPAPTAARWAAPETVKQARIEMQNALRRALAAKTGVAEAVQRVINEEGAKLRAERDIFQTRVEQTLRELQNRKEITRTEFANKLSVIKDDRERQLTERIRDAMERLREARVQSFLSALSAIDEILGRVKLRMNKAVVNGIDVSTVEPLIERADIAVAEARNVLERLAEKTYTIAITSVATLKIDVSVARDTLKEDLKNARAAIERAQVAVREAVHALASIPQIDEVELPEPTATSSPVIPSGP